MHHILSGSLLESELDTLVGQLEHVEYLTPIMRTFVGCIHRLKDAIIACGVRHVQLSANIIYDIHLFLIFIQQTHDGITMNLLTIHTSMRESMVSSQMKTASFKFSSTLFKLPYPRNPLCTSFEVIQDCYTDTGIQNKNY
jgi:hypothetical protein